jgi:large subunit ribosomal protein L2
LYRKIDFKRNKFGVLAKVCSIEYDPNRTARISLVTYLDGEKRYILHCQGLLINDLVLSDFDAPVKLANCLPLYSIPIGTLVHNIEFQVRVVNVKKFYLLSV